MEKNPANENSRKQSTETPKSLPRGSLGSTGLSWLGEPGGEEGKVASVC